MYADCDLMEGLGMHEASPFPVRPWTIGQKLYIYIDESKVKTLFSFVDLANIAIHSSCLIIYHNRKATRRFAVVIDIQL